MKLFPLLKVLKAIFLLAFLTFSSIIFAREINFSGFTWVVKNHTDITFGPGNNYWSDDNENVFVDDQGRLHLKITYRNGKWYCAEVRTKQPLGHGKYTYKIIGEMDQLDSNVVFGLFNYEYHEINGIEIPDREIDIEFSRWSDPTADNTSYSVHPVPPAFNNHRFDTNLGGTYSTHWYEWSPDYVSFRSLHGHNLSGSDIQTWVYTGLDIPPQTGNQKTHINLWLNEAFPPINGAEAEVIVKDFKFTPLSEVTLVSPEEHTSQHNPEYRWEAVFNTQWYYLWVNDSSGNRIKRWYTSSELGCENGIGICSIQPDVHLHNGDIHWWVKTWNSNTGHGVWGEGKIFTVGLRKAKLVSPLGLLSPTSSSITFTWNTVPTATWYLLWVNNASSNIFKKWYRASELGCINSKPCSIDVPINLSSGTTVYWWIQAWNTSEGKGPWSNKGNFDYQ